MIIVTEKGNNLQSCLKNQVPCQSLVDVSKYVTSQQLNNAVIVISDTNYTLQGVANFNGVENITITGKGRSLTHIYCNNTNPSGAGIIFQHSSNIILSDLTITNCGIFNKKQFYNKYVGNMSGILILSCHGGIIASRLAVSRSSGQGMTLIDTFGAVAITNSVFEYNSLTSVSGGGGLHVIMLHHFGLKMQLLKCNFTANSASAGMDTHYYGRPPQFARGGGIAIQLYSKSHSNDFTLQNVKAFNNTAIFGGGLYVYCGGHTHNNSINVLDSTFIMNKALLAGGGANVGYTTESNHLTPYYNSIEFKETRFDNNTGLYGGGLSIFIASAFDFLIKYKNVIEIEDCMFSNNKATGGTALDISPDTLKSFGKQFIGFVIVRGSKFINNKVDPKLNYKQNDEVNNGALYISKIYVTFSGDFLFTGNTNSALYITSALVTFSNSQLVFTNNIGDCGGAVHLGGSSKMLVGNNTAFTFINNTASQGGAVCAILEELHGFIYTESCFILFEGNRNATFHFINNSASSSIGTDIFVSSLQPCIGFCEYNEGVNVTVTDLFTNSCIGEYFFDSKLLTNTKKHIATYPSRINVINNNYPDPLDIFPGIPVHLKFRLLDEVGNNVGKLFPPIIKLQPAGSPMSVKQGHEVAVSNSIIIFGKPNTKGELVLESPGIKKSFNIELIQCPPGYTTMTTDTDDSLIQCICDRDRYSEVHCSNSMSIEITIGYWAGYIGNLSEHTFFTGTCAAQLCKSSNIPNGHIQNGRIQLPKNSSKLEQYVCASGRTGILCARCDENKTVYYHSISFTCGNITSCQYGIPIYIASELLPVTIIFLIILLFNISITSGAVYSFVFYAQTVSALSITAFGIVNWDNKYFQTASQILHIIYGIFNMDILNQESLSFCIVPTNSIMTLYMFKFATVFYAFFLVLATILVLRMHSCYSCVKLCRRCGRRNIRGSIVDGLSAFLVLCYFQCAQISYHILIPSTLVGLNKTNKTTVPLLDGELDYLKGAHLWYAVPAILCIIFILIPPPTILILEPILTKLFSMERFTNTQAKWLYNRLRLKLMPFLDSFQACFKDRHRYFAGLYFIYRLIGPMIGVYSAEISYTYTAHCIALLLVIACHVIIRPYKTKWHNIIDFLILMNLSIVIIFTLMNYNATLYAGSHNEIKNRSVAQIILLCFPIGYLVCYIAVTIVSRYFYSVLRRRNDSIRQSEMSESLQNEFPARLLGIQDGSRSYNTF